ncbi:ATP-dependent DNA helicase RecQ-like [Ostrea edulis]|uniref:ATP-dependent DNA helicase RecQ-like n=1 Tax=Ostrea edulis TaxID=37623 RepID=UPI002095A42E|nr:ATP-dependent DNA helicase RecQ-like [Ostrea edulis]XP_048770617.1 ATP-dependent DNA helicase RecQ-like [Ostrea edulis]XP_056015644.1 ATP-dependent DNA helicase RecQ-like [Ostrea edulis]
MKGKMADIKVIDAALEKILPRFGVSALKKEQRSILDAMIEGKDCMAILPTGFGKSLPFQVYIPLMREMNPGFSAVILVCCPLVALMQDQVKKISAVPGISAAYKGLSEESDRQILSGEIDVIYASPESLISNAVWREDMKKLNVQNIVIDEFHTIATWGEDRMGLKKQAFRKWFSHVGELRSLFPKASVIALSATSTVKIQKRVSKQLSFGPNTVEIVMSPNKANIKYSISKVSSDLEMAMSWLVDGIQHLQSDFPKTLLYCSSINDVSKLYTYLIKELDGTSPLIEMFHSETPIGKKTEIVNCLNDQNNTSKIRLVICTTALGMGIDVSHCNSVILFGIPENIVDLVQEIGRIGRDGESSIALILFNAYHLRRLDKSMKDILRSPTCRRINIMKQFLSESNLSELEQDVKKHTCCDVCHKLCSCGNCEYLSLERLFEQSVISNSDSNEAEDSFGSSDNDFLDGTLDLNSCYA